MILKSITLENYRLYMGPEIIEFAEGDKNITIIHGENDRGKTTLLNAFTWCFYGKEFYRKKGAQPVYNELAFKNLDSNDTLVVKVTIIMEDNNNRPVRFLRTQEINKSSANIPIENSSIFKIYRTDEDGEESEIKITENYMNTHLPEELREYFLFDGEQLINLLNNEEKNNSLKKGVYTLSQLDLIDNAISHMKQRKNALNNELKKINPDFGNNNIILDTLEEDQKKDKKKLKDNENQIEKFEKLIKVNSEEIKELGDDPRKIQEKIDGLKMNKDYIEDNIKTIEEDIRKYLINNFNSIFSIQTYDNFLSISQDLVEKKYIPAPFKKDFLEDLLKDKKCICGTEFTEDSDCYKELIQLFESTDEVTNLSEEVHTLKGNIVKDLNEYPNDFISELSNLKTKKENLLTDLEYVNTQLKAEKLNFKRLNHERINMLNNDNEKLSNSIKTLSEENGILRENLKSYPKKIKDIEKKIEVEEYNIKQQTKLSSKNNFCKNVIYALEEIKDNLSKEIHDQLQELTTEEFKNIHWKESYKKVIINKNFEIYFEKEDGNIINSTDPSSGTQLIVALSFMIALNSLSGFKLPLLIDTPISRLDDTVRKNLAEYLPEYLENKQLTLMVTSSEYKDAFKDKIKQHVGKEYELEFHNDFGEYTKVI